MDFVLVLVWVVWVQHHTVVDILWSWQDALVGKRRWKAWRFAPMSLLVGMESAYVYRVEVHHCLVKG